MSRLNISIAVIVLTAALSAAGYAAAKGGGGHGGGDGGGHVGGDGGSARCSGLSLFMTSVTMRSGAAVHGPRSGTTDMMPSTPACLHLTAMMPSLAICRRAAHLARAMLRPPGWRNYAARTAAILPACRSISFSRR